MSEQKIKKLIEIQSKFNCIKEILYDSIEITQNILKHENLNESEKSVVKENSK